MNKRIIKSNDEGAGGDFNTVLYSGNAGTQSITGVGFQPDFVWVKERNGTNAHYLQDIVRGNTKTLNSNETFGEGTVTNGVTSFDADGFSLGNSIAYNRSSYNYVAWCWKAGGAAVTNTDGTITSQVSANTEAGFSIVSWSANLTSGATVGHGLNSEPSLIIVKARSGADPVTNWGVYHSSLGNTKFLYLNRTDAAGTSAGFWNNTSPTSSVFTVGNSGNINGLANNMISYCFAEVEGFSKFGSYTGTGVSGNTVTVDFEPAFVMIKKSSDTGSWYMFNNKTKTGIYSDQLQANSSGAEQAGLYVKFLANGFQLDTAASDLNTGGQTFIYMAFANQF